LRVGSQRDAQHSRLRRTTLERLPEIAGMSIVILSWTVRGSECGGRCEPQAARPNAGVIRVLTPFALTPRKGCTGDGGWALRCSRYPSGWTQTVGAEIKQLWHHALVHADICTVLCSPSSQRSAGRTLARLRLGLRAVSSKLKSSLGPRAQLPVRIANASLSHAGECNTV
jgi:hypothetical protein